MRTGLLPVLSSAMLVMLAACASETQLGGGASMVTGSSAMSAETGASTSSGAAAQLVHCDRPVGTATLVESQIPGLAQYHVSSPVPLVRLMMQQSGCFQVVERGQAMGTMMGERGLQESGELRQGSNFGGGQMVAADFSITPNVIFTQSNSQGLSSGIGLVSGLAGAFIPGAGYIGALGMGTNISFSEAQTTLAVVDNRSGLQVAMAEGSATQRTISGVVGLFGGYANSNADKIVAAGFLDAYNKMVSAVESTGYSYGTQHPQLMPSQTAK